MLSDLNALAGIPYLDLSSWLGVSNSLFDRLLLVTILPPIMLIVASLAIFAARWHIAKLRERTRKRKPIENHHSTPLMSTFYLVLPVSVWLGFIVSAPASSFAFLAVRECDCSELYNASGGVNGKICFSPADYGVICRPPPVQAPSNVAEDGQSWGTRRLQQGNTTPPSNATWPLDGDGALRFTASASLLDDYNYDDYDRVQVIASTCIAIYGFGVPIFFFVALSMSRAQIVGLLKPTKLSAALSFLYAEYRPGLWY